MKNKQLKIHISENPLTCKGNSFTDDEIKVWLHDILNAISEIEIFFNDVPKEFLKYKADLKTKRAVERNIEIIGEAMSRILKKDKSIIITQFQKTC